MGKYGLSVLCAWLSSLASANTIIDVGTGIAPTMNPNRVLPIRSVLLPLFVNSTDSTDFSIQELTAECSIRLVNDE